MNIMQNNQFLLVHFEQDARHQGCQAPFVLALGPNERVWMAKTDKGERTNVNVDALEFARAQKLKLDTTLTRYTKPKALNAYKPGDLFHAGLTGTGTVMGLFELQLEAPAEAVV